ncbi:Mut7-C RNAse domain-containing protein [candidate division KSB1 bacterium]|nr:Mut7-C RNAse domain-containing protein [candidate division KSB1 bacterium]
MLGRLAKWLRILGYDTLYDAAMADNELFFIAHLEKRILLTRDGELARRMNPRYCTFIHSDHVREQVKQVLVEYGLNSEDHIFTRCTLCNGPLIDITRESVKGRVPDFVYAVTDKFVYCSHCDKIYWPGSHLKGVRQILNEIRETDT